MKRKIMNCIFLLCLFLISIQYASLTARASVIQDCRESVVYIETDRGSGTGFFIGEEDKPVKYIVTNYHVVKNAAYISVGINDTCFESASPVFIDINKDMAVLELSSETNVRPPLMILTSEHVAIAQKVYALGFPGGSFRIDHTGSINPEDVTITSGIISKRITNSTAECYQIDVSITFGNSGGPLVTEEGAVIGINSFGDPQDRLINGAIMIDELIPALDAIGIPYELYEGGTNSKDTSKSEDRKDTTSESASVEKDEGNKEVRKDNKSNGDEKVLGMDKNIIFIGIVFLAVLFILLIVILKKINTGAAQVSQPNRQTYPMQTNPGVDTKKTVIYGLTGRYTGKRFPLDNVRLIFGRDTSVCNVIYPSTVSGISRVHCELYYDSISKKCILIDKGSSNGTYTGNGERLSRNEYHYLDFGENFYLASKENMFELRKE